MIKIRISYDTEQEAARIIKVLSPVIAGAKIKRSESGRYRKIYIECRRGIEKND